MVGEQRAARDRREREIALGAVEAEPRALTAGEQDQGHPALAQQALAGLAGARLRREALGAAGDGDHLGRTGLLVLDRRRPQDDALHQVLDDVKVEVRDLAREPLARRSLEGLQPVGERPLPRGAKTSDGGAVGRGGDGGSLTAPPTQAAAGPGPVGAPAARIA